ncbi:hypothetical protein PAPYR_3701 [Paratrimastix pyriformis]|uniref:Uncharacterized protein n=1 Tax=Paratrimastix pyriformis TaxID=342808 RepID=A0ABQ8USG5_9EUKA|nr:hypothetical protein PAPYR_3701 [Paratrimastix pyriformis]
MARSRADSMSRPPNEESIPPLLSEDQRKDLQIQELQTQLAGATLRPSSDSMSQFRDWNRQIQEAINKIRTQCESVALEQRQAIQRGFRERLKAVEADLEAERHKQPEHDAAHWIKKFKESERQNDWFRNEAFRLDRLNVTLTAELNRLKQDYAQEQSDRENLIAQIVKAKKENARLQAELSAVKEAAPEDARSPRLEALPAPVARDGRAAATVRKSATAPIHPRAILPASGPPRAAAHPSPTLSRSVRRAHVAALAERTELQVLLRQCVVDVKQEIAARRAERLAPGQEERVVKLLYERTFPPAASGPAASGASPQHGYSRGGKTEDELAREPQQQQQDTRQSPPYPGDSLPPIGSPLSGRAAQGRFAIVEDDAPPASNKPRAASLADLPPLPQDAARDGSQDAGRRTVAQPPARTAEEEAEIRRVTAGRGTVVYAGPERKGSEITPG